MNAHFEIEFVPLGVSGDGTWFISEDFEYRVKRAADGAVVLRFPGAHIQDNSEYPERRYTNGPQRVLLHPSGTCVVCEFSESHLSGVSFEGQVRPPVYEYWSLSTFEQISAPD